MHLSLEQGDRFFDVMDALLAYVNDRFGVVEGFALDYDDPLMEPKAALVAAELWANVDVIDDFCAENPFRLPARDVAVAAGWKDAVRGSFTLVRYQAGRALLMDDERVFSVCGVTSDLEEVVGRAPAVVEAVLIPFEGVVVYDGFMGVNDVPPRRLGSIEDDFERLVAAGVVATQDDLAQVSRARRARQREADFDALLAGLADAGSQQAEAVPVGFHRSAIAGLAGQERAAAVEEHFRQTEAAAGRPYAPVPPEPAPAPGSERDQVERAVLCADACVTYCGVVALADAYAQYRTVYEGSFAEAQFADVLAREATYGDLSFELWFDHGTPYLVHYTLTREFVANETLRQPAADNGALAGTVAEELDNLDDLLQFLLEEHRRFPMRPVPRVSVEMDELVQLNSHWSVRALRDFLDERVPDGEDDWFFSDGVAGEVVMSIIESGQMQAPLAYLADLGLDGCCADADRLPRLVKNVFDSMPSWENNGWSPRELKEQLTGRKQFFDERGEQLVVGSNDPCPCGSGKPYKDCHGR